MTTVSPSDMGNIAYVTSNTAWMAPNFNNLNMSAVAEVITDWYNVNGGENSSDVAFAEFLGTSLDWVNITYNFFGNKSVFIDEIAYCAELTPFLPHPLISPAFTPVYVVLSILTIVFVVLRFYSRIYVQGKIWVYDWILLVGFLAAFGNATTDVVVYELCRYRAIWDFTWPQFQLNQAGSLVVEVLNPLALMLVKTSLLVFYHTLTKWPPFRYGIYFIGFIIFGNWLPSTFIPLFSCRPVLYWEGTGWMYEYCPLNGQQTLTALYVSNGVNLVTDVLIWVLPLPLIARLPITTREKFLSVLTFGTGILACIASGFGIYWRKYSVVSAEPYNYGDYITIWRTVEIYLGIICACVPAIRALIIKKMPKILSYDAASDESSADAKTYTDGTSTKKNDIITHSGSVSSEQIDHEKRIY